MTPNIDGYSPTLCKVEFTSERFYGQAELDREMDEEKSAQRITKQQNNATTAQLILTNILSDGTSKTRKDIQQKLGGKVRREAWIAVDSILESNNVKITKGDHGAKLYQLYTVDPLP